MFGVLVDIQGIEVFMMKPPSINHSPYQIVPFKKMRVHILKCLFVIQSVECLIGKGDSRAFQIVGCNIIQRVQAGVASLVAKIEAIDLLGVKPTKQAVCMSSFIMAFFSPRELQRLTL